MHEVSVGCHENHMLIAIVRHLNHDILLTKHTMC